ncbi:MULTISPECIES: heavy-metal-associated domain-containing protein [unclassified Rhodococcus (in: high G+C Gram-positive bacteria)]|uniref:heavy-metal-associated domain-containing protein n=1 Tax=unclassified Rhodococcus (in: high G+C Gram-positive bacteria) TaxID=192944 RepID=UPI0011EE1291|nr:MULTISPECIES: heavy-metal-associated domain-containing protein [unclassified Rhodococcus (in: high G+C Gram-positive bacteria)]KAA0925287.1 heavy-metal-associated domain-containing protein [Rhodococcus sp. ANT_H53B]MDI9928551.1 heavy-metal-associated domain-containing protein [Rhodococcus sp. IEGM 1341]MDZ7929901.1 heavy-metal-associated domain-containing protein [Rhodococcus sp. (in: high G+C Gram-positive bacteria)]
MQTTYSVEGMTCGHCAASVREEVSEISGVTGVDVDVDSGAVVVSSDSALDTATVDAAVAEAGYRLVS